MTTAKRPASQYYWGNWLADTALQSCSLAARGLWHEMNCHMHQAEPYGHLYVNGKPVSAEKLANLCRISANSCRKHLQELEDAGVFSRDEKGAIFSRRMVRDEVAREKSAEAGRSNGNKGSEYGHLGAEYGALGGRPKKSSGGVIPLHSETPLETPQNPPSSTASASSAAANTVPVVEAVGAEKPKARGSRLPADWALPDAWRDWAKTNRPDLNPEGAADRFRDYWAAKTGASATKLDWEATWRNWVRGERPDKTVRRTAAPTAPEPDWRREQRERMATAAPYAVARTVPRPTNPQPEEDPQHVIPLPLPRTAP